VVLAYKPFGAPLTACRQTAADVQADFARRIPALPSPSVT
jgi:hypothetical protein